MKSAAVIDKCQIKKSSRIKEYFKILYEHENKVPKDCMQPVMGSCPACFYHGISSENTGLFYAICGRIDFCNDSQSGCKVFGKKD